MVDATKKCRFVTKRYLKTLNRMLDGINHFVWSQERFLTREEKDSIQDVLSSLQKTINRFTLVEVVEQKIFEGESYEWER